MFLDINMPHLSGLDFLESLDNPPLTILTTAYSEYALESFRLNVVDYLMKPIAFKRFFQAVSKAQDMFQLHLLLKNGKDEAKSSNVCSFLVNIAHIESVAGGRLFINGKELPISKPRREELMNTVVYRNLISK